MPLYLWLCLENNEVNFMPGLGLVELIILTVLCDLAAIVLVVAAYKWYQRRN